MAVATVNSSTNGFTKKIRQDGLPNHLSCRVVDLCELKLTPKSSIKLLKIRQNVLTRDKHACLSVWEAASKQWLTELQKIRPGETTEPGTFWMDIKTFLEKFYCTTVCHWQPNYGYCYFSDTHSSSGHAVASLVVPYDIISKVVFTMH
jgi:hypothetical protein